MLMECSLISSHNINKRSPKTVVSSDPTLDHELDILLTSLTLLFLVLCCLNAFGFDSDEFVIRSKLLSIILLYVFLSLIQLTLV